MGTRYFNITVKPEVTASKQAEGAFADNDVLFDWTAFDIPKGASRLISATIVAKTADGTTNSQAINLCFAKSIDNVAPSSIGTIHAGAAGVGYFNNILGFIQSEETDSTGSGPLGYVSVSNFNNNRMGALPMVLTGEPDSGTNVGFDKLYLAATSVDGTPTFASTVQCDGIQATTQNILTVKTINAQRVFAAGDVLHDEDDRLLGTVKSVDSATQITMVDNLANAAVDNKDVYNLNPYIVYLSFEK